MVEISRHNRGGITINFLGGITRMSDLKRQLSSNAAVRHNDVVLVLPIPTPEKSRPFIQAVPLRHDLNRHRTSNLGAIEIKFNVATSFNTPTQPVTGTTVVNKQESVHRTLR